MEVSFGLYLVFGVSDANTMKSVYPDCWGVCGLKNTWCLMSLNIAAQSSQNVKLVTKVYTWAKQADEQVQVPSLPVLQRTLPELDWTLTESARLVFDPMAQTILLTQPPKWLCLQPCSLLARFQTSPTASSFVEGNTPNQRNSELRICTGSHPLAWEQPHPRRKSSFSYTVVLVPWGSSTFCFL